MARNLIELIKASGGAGINGQSFRNNAAGAPLADGVRMTDYVLNGINFTGSIPVNDIPGGYGSSTLFSITANFSCGGSFGLIQRDEQSAWTFSVVGGTNAAVTLESWSSNGAGVSHNLGVRVLGALNALPGMSVSSVSDSTLGSNPEPVTFTANPTNLGGTGQTLLEIIPTYDPDTANFNPTLIFDSPDSWTGWFNNRGLDADTDFDYEWRTLSGGSGYLIAMTRSFRLENDFGWFNGTADVGLVYPTAWEYPDSPYSSNNGLLPAETSQEIYLRWRIKPSSGGNGTWNNFGPYTHLDTRQGQQ